MSYFDVSKIHGFLNYVGTKIHFFLENGGISDRYASPFFHARIWCCVKCESLDLYSLFNKKRNTIFAGEEHQVVEAC